MRRQCARPGCSAVATTTFTFDSHERIVFLDAPRDGAARAGELCARHARALDPPRGWRVLDRRSPDAATTHGGREAIAPAAVILPAPQELPQEQPNEQIHVAASVVLPAAAPVPAPAPTGAWHPRFDRADTLDGILEANTPLLARAFRNVRAG
jgi:hypothetical protein